MRIPGSLVLANLPTSIERLGRLSEELGVNVFVKRDDQTGSEITGNKVRKLEFAIQEALDQGCDYLITCGGIQSNHARATAAVAAKLGLGSCLVLRSSGGDNLEGNFFFGKLLGADIRFVTPVEYRESRMDIMKEITEELAAKGHRAYIIPEGASNGIGSFGYFKALEEILGQEKELDVKFDAVVATVGSGGTYAGLFYANKGHNNSGKVYGINICDDAEYFKDKVVGLIDEMNGYTGQELNYNRNELNIIDGYVGDGYALSRHEELEFIHWFARLEGIILDPVYTGKAMYGLVEEIKKGTFKDCTNILFLHTGGIFGWTESARLAFADLG
ncbi:D-cysteine desulfhydrase family protein [Alkalicella caledoniensis]|uniref:D-cysteine desulfhydrase family protein n=1 Tax=Alkalicella caledoniensis TaxID=2731377 RepID=A0A7G9WDJ8_ALKCA|nr:D-cysteine desulfhydrase family protein [Alkalicella caledoniensis]QNO16760.1 D-cysteine desulfhydrase family protein [Alkalicella caledoniensis]